MKFKKRYIPLIGIFVVMPTAFATVSYLKAYSQPYGKAELNGVETPGFRQVSFPFISEFNGNKSLPFMGSAIIDVDGDGTPEVFLGGGYDQPDALLKFENGKFINATSALGKGLTKSKANTTMGAAVVDANGDGRTDMFVARDKGVTLYLNTADGFEGVDLDIPLNAKSSPLSISLADLNGDGWVDMFLANYIKLDHVEGQNIFNKDGYGATSLLLLNNGDNTFTDITDQAGMNFVHNTFVGVFSDVDRDGDQDIVVAHDTGHVRTWRNNGDLTFTSAPNPSSDVYGYPMGVAVGDYDNDQRLDYFFSNVSSTAPAFLAKGDLTDDQTYHPWLYLFRNEGDFKFSDAAAKTKTAKYEFSWGTVFDDLNNDGREDLLIAQNYARLPFEKLFKLPGRVLLQKDDGTFTHGEDAMGLVNRHFAITPLTADFNDDGYRDVIWVNLEGESRAFISEGGKNGWFKLRLSERPESLGAIADVTLDNGTVLTQQVVSGEGLASDQSHELIFGLGESVAVAGLKVTYANGRVATAGEQDRNSTLVLK